MSTLTEQAVRRAVKTTVKDIISDYRKDSEVSRETVIDRVFEETDALFGQLVKSGRIDQYTVDDMVATAQPASIIIKVAEKDAWVEDDHGLWEGLTYGVLASIAFFSLEHLVYEGLKQADYDTNDEHPFAGKAA